MLMHEKICVIPIIFLLCNTWGKVFKIIPEFRILHLNFPKKVSLKMLNSAGYNIFSDLVSIYLKVYLTIKLGIFDNVEAYNRF